LGDRRITKTSTDRQAISANANTIAKMSPIPLPTVHPFLLAACLSPWFGNRSLPCSEE
jgi:hypothetical protein